MIFGRKPVEAAHHRKTEATCVDVLCLFPFYDIRVWAVLCLRIPQLSHKLQHRTHGENKFLILCWVDPIHRYPGPHVGCVPRVGHTWFVWKTAMGMQIWTHVMVLLWFWFGRQTLGGRLLMAGRLCGILFIDSGICSYSFLTLLNSSTTTIALNKSHSQEHSRPACWVSNILHPLSSKAEGVWVFACLFACLLWRKGVI